MPARAYVSAETPSSAAPFREHSDRLRWELASEERVGTPIMPKRKRWWLRAAALLAVACGGWAFFTDPVGTRDWTSQRLSSAASWGEAMLSEWHPIPRPAELPTPPASLTPLQLLDSAVIESAGRVVLGATSDLAIKEVARAEAEAAPPPAEQIDETAAKPAEIEKPAPLPPLPPLTDPIQKRAEAVGLHPDLSRALLQSLTATDFKNAATAIKKAIAETPDDAVLVWPPQPKPGIARFRIHFVPGISPACRRYVVGVGKNGWLTTALPMERCGVKPKLSSKPPVERAASTTLPKR
jgi:hypothetical protein